MFMKANDYYVLISPCLMSESRQFSITLRTKNQISVLVMETAFVQHH